MLKTNMNEGILAGIKWSFIFIMAFALIGFGCYSYLDEKNSNLIKIERPNEVKLIKIETEMLSGKVESDWTLQYKKVKSPYINHQNINEHYHLLNEYTSKDIKYYNEKDDTFLTYRYYPYRTVKWLIIILIIILFIIWSISIYNFLK